jgi:hypothetical protein
MVLDVLQAIGSVFGALAIAGGGVWAITQLFLYGRLTRKFTVDVEHREFAANDRRIVLVETTFTNESRATTRVMGIYFRPILPRDWSWEAREIERRTAEWRYLGGGPETLWRPGERLHTVFEVEWPKDRLSIPLHFRLVYQESITEQGLLSAIRHLLFRLPGRRRDLTLYRLLSHPSIQSVDKEGTAA